MSIVLVITGPPGTGKSTLAEHIAAHLSAPILSWDWIVGGLAAVRQVKTLLASLEHEEYRRVGWSVMTNLAILHMRAGRCVVMDGAARLQELEAVREVAAQHDARLISVVTRCSDLQVHRSRVEGRNRAIPGWHELEWEYVAEFLADWYEPPADLYLDAVAPLDANLSTLITYAAAKPPQSH